MPTIEKIQPALPARQKVLTTGCGQLIVTAALLTTDYLAIVLAMVTAAFVRKSVLAWMFPGLPAFHLDSGYILSAIPLLYVALLAYEGMYVKRLPFWQSSQRLLKVAACASALLLGFLYFSGQAAQVSRTFVFISGILNFLYLAVFRHYARRLLALLGIWRRPLIIVGAGKTAELLAASFERDADKGYQIHGLIEDHPQERPLAKRYPYLGTFPQAEAAVAASGVKDVLVAAPGLGKEQLLALVQRIQPYATNVMVVPDLPGIPLNNLTIDTVLSDKIVVLGVRNNLKITYNRLLKRGFDLVSSLAGLIILAPVLLAIAAAIYLYSPGPVIFAHTRVGIDGRPFRCYKFRSMVTNAQQVLADYLAANSAARREWAENFKLRDDPRVTPIGRFLRKSSLDELPQLFNVLTGDMSLVGPRPIVKDEIAKYGDLIADYYRVRPGITGFWQVNGRSDVDYETRVGMDSWYVRNWSFWLDIILLSRTFKVVMSGKGAC
jgi:undecaprenyl-phosphate galactose phosphotransferase